MITAENSKMNCCSNEATSLKLLANLGTFDPSFKLLAVTCLTAMCKISSSSQIALAGWTDLQGYCVLQCKEGEMKVFLRCWLCTDWPSALSSASLGLVVSWSQSCVLLKQHSRSWVSAGVEQPSAWVVRDPWGAVSLSGPGHSLCAWHSEM